MGVGSRMLTAGVGIPTLFFLLRTEIGSLVLIEVATVIALLEYQIITERILIHEAKGSKEPSEAAAESMASLKERLLYQFLLPFKLAVLCPCVTFFFPSTLTTVLFVSLSNALLLAHHAFSVTAKDPEAEPTTPSPSHPDLLRLVLEILVIGIIGQSFAYFVLIRRLGLAPTVLFLSTMWICDTGALVFGSLLKDHYFLPQSYARRCRRCLAIFSPKKTVAGIIGGLIFGCMTVLLSYIGVQQGLLPASAAVGKSVLQAVSIGLAVSAMGIFGDLVESYGKRAGRCKDSGKLLPGHGGILDRVDSLLFAAPVFYHLIKHSS